MVIVSSFLVLGCRAAEADRSPIGEMRTASAVSAAASEPEMPTALPSMLSENVVITERRFLANDQLFGRGMQGITVLIENRNDVAVDITIRGTLYQDDRVVLELPGTGSIEPHQTLLMPLTVDRSVAFTKYEVNIVDVSPR